MIRLAGGGGGGSAGTPTVVMQLKGSGAGNYTTVSASYVAVDAVNLAVARTTPVSQIILIWVDGSVDDDADAHYASVAIAKDGAAVAETVAGGFGGQAFYPFGLNYSEPGDGASHTWAIYWKVSGGNGTMYNSSASAAPFMNIMQLAAT